MEDDAYETSNFGKQKQRYGEQVRSNKDDCKNKDVCGRTLSAFAARQHRFCSYECELGWTRMNSNRETYNKTFFNLCKSVPYMPKPHMKKGEEEFDLYYPKEVNLLRQKVIDARTN